MLEYPYHHQTTPQKHPKEAKKFRKRSTFPKCVPPKRPEQQQFQDFRGTHSPTYMGEAAAKWVPWVLKYPYCNQMTTQTHPRGDKRVLGKSNFQKLSGATKLPKQKQFQGPWLGLHGPSGHYLGRGGGGGGFLVTYGIHRYFRIQPLGGGGGGTKFVSLHIHTKFP